MKEFLFLLKLGLIFLLIGNSCKKADIPENGKVISISTKNIKHKINLSLIANEPKLVKLYTDSAFMIGDIRQIKYGRKIYVQNFQKILVFNTDGSPAYTINKQGKSGAEYYEINDFHVDTLNNRIEVWDRVKRQILSFDNKTGAFIETLKWDIDADYFKKINKTYFFYSSAAYSKKGENASRIICLDKDGEIKNEFLKSDYIKLYALSTPYFLNVLNNEVFYNDAPLNTIYKITEKECVPVYKIDIDNKSMVLEELLGMKDLRADKRANKMRNTCSYSSGEAYVWDNGICLYIRSNGNWYLCFYYPETNNTIVGAGIFDDYILNLEIWHSNISDGKLICLLPAYEIKKKFKNEGALQKSNPAYHQMIKGLNKFDNHILIISDLKEFK